MRFCDSLEPDGQVCSDCDSANVACLVTCNKCYMQCVDETEEAVRRLTQDGRELWAREYLSRSLWLNLFWFMGVLLMTCNKKSCRNFWNFKTFSLIIFENLRKSFSFDFFVAITSQVTS